MKILITGGSGFVGGHLVQLLLSQGHQLCLLMRNPKQINFHGVQPQLICGGLEDSKKWKKLIPKDLDAVIHCAGIVHSYCNKEFYRINTRGTQVLMDALSGQKNDLRFILISSLAAAGPSQKRGHSEQDPSNPISHYGKSKLQAEELLLKHPTAWEKIIIRPPIVMGPGDRGMFDIFAQTQKGLALYAGKNDFAYSFICVQDLVTIIQHCLNKDIHQPTLLYASHPETFLFAQLIQTIQKELEVKKLLSVHAPKWLLKAIAQLLSPINLIIPLSIKLTPDKIKEVFAGNWCCQSQKFSFDYQWDLTATIKATIKDYRLRGWLN